LAYYIILIPDYVLDLPHIYVMQEVVRGLETLFYVPVSITHLNSYWHAQPDLGWWQRGRRHLVSLWWLRVFVGIRKTPGIPPHQALPLQTSQVTGCHPMWKKKQNARNSQMTKV